VKRFIFRLQKVEELRRWRELVSQQKLAEARSERKSAEQDLEKSRREMSSLDRRRRKVMEKGFTAGAALREAHYAQHLRKEAAGKEQKLGQAERVVAQCRDDLVEKSRDRKVLEKLRERRQADFQMEMNHKEQAILDDDASRRHHYDPGGNRRRVKE